MFNALNRFISRLDGDPQHQRQREREQYGFQVLRNTNLELAIEPWFDFIVGINGRMIDNPDARLFAQEVRNCAGGTVALGIWSAKGQRTRALHIPVPAATGTLGLSLQWAPLATASENVWHVLDVAAGSPADTAGLLPYGDYVLGTPDGALHGEAALGELVDEYATAAASASGGVGAGPLRLWVYNHEYDVAREVEVAPSRDWGGEGALGCVLGYGALHRLPAPLSEPVHAPGETMFDGGGTGEDSTITGAGQQQFAAFAPPGAAADASGNMFVPAGVTAPSSPSSNDFLIPAQMVSATTTTATTSPPPPGGAAATPPPRGGRKKERGHGHGHGHGHGAANRLDDYFAEQEKKSKELEGGSISASKTPPPPPPKAGPGILPPPRATPKPQAAEESGDGSGVD